MAIEDRIDKSEKGLINEGGKGGSLNVDDAVERAMKALTIQAAGNFSPYNSLSPMPETTDYTPVLELLRGLGHSVRKVVTSVYRPLSERGPGIPSKWHGPEKYK